MCSLLVCFYSPRTTVSNCHGRQQPQPGIARNSHSKRLPETARARNSHSQKQLWGYFWLRPFLTVAVDGCGCFWLWLHVAGCGCCLLWLFLPLSVSDSGRSLLWLLLTVAVSGRARFRPVAAGLCVFLAVDVGCGCFCPCLHWAVAIA